MIHYKYMNIIHIFKIKYEQITYKFQINSNMPVNEVFKNAVKEIKFRSGLNQAQIAAYLGVRSTYLSDMINGRVPLTENISGKIYQLFGVVISETPSRAAEEPAPDANACSLHADIFMVPLVSKYAYAGYLSGYGDEEYVGTLPSVPFIIPEGQTHRGEYVAFEVKGDSMDDGTDASLKDGDVVLCRKIKRELWTGGCKLHYKKYNFVIAHTEGILIKRIVAHDVERGTVTIHSLNADYPDRQLDLNEVTEIRNVVQFQRKPVL